MNNPGMKFVKVSATGNDFILIDNRDGRFSGDEKSFFRKLCRRRMGVGADGVILLEESERADLGYRHINADGSPAEMCGNGARSLCYYAFSKKMAPSHLTFEIGGEVHQAWITKKKVKLRIPPPSKIQDNMGVLEDKDFEEGGFIVLGVPHLILFTESLDSVNVDSIGRELSSHPEFENRTNVNFVQHIGAQTIRVRTYERGVESETLSCGTGSTASAIIAHIKKKIPSPVVVHNSGGKLRIEWENYHESVFLTGPASIVYEAELKDLPEF
ncbi:MAG: diaminopimelate epimerase [Candidatus Aminicenantes bacterium]|jgi:diaminopimelate epimerase